MIACCQKLLHHHIAGSLSFFNNNNNNNYLHSHMNGVACCDLDDCQAFSYLVLSIAVQLQRYNNNHLQGETV